MSSGWRVALGGGAPRGAAPQPPSCLLLRLPQNRLRPALTGGRLRRWRGLGGRVACGAFAFRPLIRLVARRRRVRRERRDRRRGRPPLRARLWTKRRARLRTKRRARLSTNCRVRLGTAQRARPGTRAGKAGGGRAPRGEGDASFRLFLGGDVGEAFHYVIARARRHPCRQGLQSMIPHPFLRRVPPLLLLRRVTRPLRLGRRRLVGVTRRSSIRRLPTPSLGRGTRVRKGVRKGGGPGP
mmetsp:Transcript_44875/g.105680  ORF Transcript_44875/g.105680 Transcript_44875/m.105680 type:complete len:240 (+) Transcript_44875:91-810(+)